MQLPAFLPNPNLTYDVKPQMFYGSPRIVDSTFKFFTNDSEDDRNAIAATLPNYVDQITNYWDKVDSYLDSRQYGGKEKQTRNFIMDSVDIVLLSRICLPLHLDSGYWSDSNTPNSTNGLGFTFDNFRATLVHPFQKLEVHPFPPFPFVTPNINIGSFIGPHGVLYFFTYSNVLTNFTIYQIGYNPINFPDLQIFARNYFALSCTGFPIFLPSSIGSIFIEWPRDYFQYTAAKSTTKAIETHFVTFKPLVDGDKRGIDGQLTEVSTNVYPLAFFAPRDPDGPFFSPILKLNPVIIKASRFKERLVSFRFPFVYQGKQTRDPDIPLSLSDLVPNRTIYGNLKQEGRQLLEEAMKSSTPISSIFLPDTLKRTQIKNNKAVVSTVFPWVFPRKAVNPDQFFLDPRHHQGIGFAMQKPSKTPHVPKKKRPYENAFYLKEL